MSSLKARKQLLIAESELNRIRLVREWEKGRDGAVALSHSTQSVARTASAVISMVSSLVSPPGRAPRPPQRPFSWWDAAAKGTRLAVDIWRQLYPPDRTP